MYLLGDIGNTEIKICLVNSNYKILKKIILKTNSISYKYLDYNFSFFLKYSKRIQKILFSSVVPVAFKKIKLLISKNLKKKYLNLKKLI